MKETPLVDAPKFQLLNELQLLDQLIHVGQIPAVAMLSAKMLVVWLPAHAV
jgi:hypothetical protein